MLGRIKSFIKNYLLQRKGYQFIVKDWISLTDIQQAKSMLATMRFSQNLYPTLTTKPQGKRILAIAPHPDDVTLGAGGSLLKAMNDGAEVLTIYLTSGREKIQERKQEAQLVASQFGHQILFFDYLPEQIPIDEVSISRLATAINEFSPDLLFLPFCLDDHDDHRRASHLLLTAYNSGLLKCQFDVWAYQVYSTLLPNVIVDISKVSKRKAEIIKMWKSQCVKRDWAHYTLGLNAFNQRFLPNDSKPKYAETFFVLPLKEYMNYCSVYFEPDATRCYYFSQQYKNEVSI